ncbi:hypothetical protein ACFL5A_02885 [Gemmatimonadota bacterium]
MASKLSFFLAELKRRKVYHVGAVYAAVGVAISIAVPDLFGAFLFPSWAAPLVIVVIVIAFPIALVLAWAYEVRPEEPGEAEKAPAPVSAPSESERKSIVVLPFDNMSPDTGDAYFSDGLTEEIITHLSCCGLLRVISRNSAMVLKGTQKSTRAIAEELKVQYVLEGSVRKAGEDLRITAQLIHAAEDEHLWAETYEGTMEDVFRIQENTARSIVEALRLSLTPEEDQRLAERPFDDVQAFQFYLKARSEFWSTEPGSQEKALRLLHEAVNVIGEHPLLISGIGAVHWQFHHQLGEYDHGHLNKIQDCAEKLFADDPASPYGHRLTGYLKLDAGDTDEATRHLYQAWRGDPNDAETLLWLSYFLAFQAGRPAMSRPVAERYLGIDPLDPLCRSGMFMLHWMNGDTGLALEAVDEGLRIDPHLRTLAFHRGHLLTWDGRYEDSFRQAEALFDEDPNEAMGQALRFLTLSLQGRKEEALTILTTKVREWFWGDFHLPWLIVEGLSILGEKREAMRWLERAIEKGIFNYPLFSSLDPFLENIRSEEEFKFLMAHVKEKWEAFEV